MSARGVGSPREYAWMAGAGESGWHAVAVSIGGEAPIAVCGHRLAGPVHRRLGTNPPQDGVRMVCAPCVRAAGTGEPHRQHPPGHIGRPAADLEIQWPQTDPDDAEGPTRRRPALDAAMAVLLTPAIPEPREASVGAKSAVVRRVPRFVA